MKGLSTFLVLCTILTLSCSKSKKSTAPATFEAKINGLKSTFNVNAATLFRSTANNEKTFDITGTSVDGLTRIGFTLIEKNATGNGLQVKAFTLNQNPEDDPATPDVNESLLVEGFTAYSTSTGNGNWNTDLYNENGTLTVTACDAESLIISGTFETTLTDINTGTTVIPVTEGKFDNVKYVVLN